MCLVCVNNYQMVKIINICVYWFVMFNAPFYRLGELGVVVVDMQEGFLSTIKQDEAYRLINSQKDLYTIVNQKIYLLQCLNVNQWGKQQRN